MSYYAVKKGIEPGVYLSWEECNKQIDGFSGAEYKKFKTEDEARKVIEILSTRFWHKWIIQEVTKDLETLNKDGIPYSSRYKVLKELE